MFDTSKLSHRKALLSANAIILVTAAASYLRLPPEVPLWYSRVEGEMQIAPWWMILVIPVLMNLFVFLNVFMQRKLFAESPFVKRLVDRFNHVLMAAMVLLFLKILSLIVI
jgi:hypothetical protein